MEEMKRKRPLVSETPRGPGILSRQSLKLVLSTRCGTRMSFNFGCMHVRNISSHLYCTSTTNPATKTSGQFSFGWESDK